MSVLLFPMWLLSGAFFPAPAAGWLAWVMRLNPLTYGVTGLRQVMFPQIQAAGTPLAVNLAVMALFAAVCTVFDVWLTTRAPRQS
jgi:ABC-type polysaccharide/polyol phosphate export permease